MDDIANDVDDVTGDAGHGARIPPYISFKTLLTFLEDQQQHGVPMQIDRSVLTRFSGGVGSQLIAALKFLDLIDADKNVRPALQTLVTSYGTDEWQTKLRELLERSYRPIFQHDLERVTPQQFHDLFKAQYPAKDAVVRKCEIFFLNAAKAAGVAINPRIVKHRASRPNGSTVRRPQAKPSAKRNQAAGGAPKREEEPPPNRDPQPQSVYEVLIGMLDPVEMDDTEQEAVWTLIRYQKRMEDA